VAGFAWGFILLVAAPRGFGNWLLGPIWRSTYPLVLPQMLFVIGQGIGFGVGTGLHALAAARRSLRLTVLMSVLFVIGSLVGGAAGGAPGTVWGAAVSQWIGSVYGWWQLRAAQRDAGHLSARDRLRSTHPGRRRRHRARRSSPPQRGVRSPTSFPATSWNCPAPAGAMAGPAITVRGRGGGSTRWPRTRAAVSASGRTRVRPGLFGR
jgi:hypothetical protein